MPEFEFDVDASIAAGWDRFAARLATLLRDLVPGATFDLAVPVLDAPSSSAPFLRFTGVDPGLVHAEVSGGGSGDSPTPLSGVQLGQLAALGWRAGADPGPGSDSPASATPPPATPPSATPPPATPPPATPPPATVVPAARSSVTPGPQVTWPPDRAPELAQLVARTMERVFGVPHPVFLQDVVDSDALAAPGGSTGAVPDDADFRPRTITDPDEATRAVGDALAEVFRRRVDADEHGVFTVPAGCVLLFVRAHRSLPLIVFRSPLVASVEDVAAAETEVAILNRDSLWCRYVFDGRTISAESEFVDRVFVPVNFKIQLAELSAELDDVYADLARRVAGRRWRDLRAADDHGSGEQ